MSLSKRLFLSRFIFYVTALFFILPIHVNYSLCVSLCNSILFLTGNLSYLQKYNIAMIKTKIVCTLGPACATAAILTEMINAGMRVARVNCSHGSMDEHAASLQLVRAVSKETGIPIAVLFDLCGPKVRTGAMEKPLVLVTGQEFTLTTRTDLGENEAPLGMAEIAKHVYSGARIVFDDGALEAEVLDNTDTDIRCKALNAAPLGSKKGINLPGISLPIPALTEKDIEDARQALTLGADWIAMSFVRDAKDIDPLHALMQEVGITRPIIAKIEKHEAITNLDAIVAAYDGLMVARGDLGVEVSLEGIPELQKTIINTANAAGKPVITATQMLDSMIRNPRPTRAEVTDVANAIFDGTDAVMLSGETSIGLYPAETVQTMARIAQSAEDGMDDFCNCNFVAPRYDEPIGALAVAAVQMADHLNAPAIITATSGGGTALLISKSRPEQMIVAVTDVPETLTRMPLYRGVIPLLVSDELTREEMLERAVRHALKLKLLKDGDVVVAVSVNAQPLGVITRASNILRIAHVVQKM
jgi:pyruvate kinase